MKNLKAHNTESIKKFTNFVNELRDSYMGYEEFVEEVRERVVEHDNDGNPRDEEAKAYWENSLERYIDGHPSYITSPMILLYRAYKSGYYELDDINDQSLGRASEVISHASEGMEGQGFGSSDWTFLMKEFLDSEGIKADFINNRLQRLTEEQAEILEAQKKIQHILNWGIGYYNDEYKKEMRNLGDTLVDKGLAVKTGKSDGKLRGDNEYELTEKGKKLSKLELAEAAVGKKLNESTDWTEEEQAELDKKHEIAKKKISDNPEKFSRSFYNSSTLYYADNYMTVIHKNVGSLNDHKTELYNIHEDSIIAVSKQNGSLGTLYDISVLDNDGNEIETLSTWSLSLDGFTPIAYIEKRLGKFKGVKIK